jgi:uncharacterized protein with HEPN domain
MAAPRDPRIVLEQMLEAIGDIEQITSGRSFAAYAADRPTRRAVERCLEIVSEASRRLPPDLKDRHPAIPWPKIAGIGNVLRHDYDVVNDATIWHAAREGRGVGLDTLTPSVQRVSILASKIIPWTSY